MLKEKGAQHEKSCEKGLFEVVSDSFFTLSDHFNVPRGLSISRSRVPLQFGAGFGRLLRLSPIRLILSYLIYAST